MVVKPGPRLVVSYGDEPAHALLRAEAARFHDVEPRQIVVVHECPRCGSGEHGRPRLLPTARLRSPAYVSLARAGGLSVVAITDAGQVGVDVEAEGAAEAAGVREVALHPDERSEPRADLTRIWVRKEALLKAYGLGLAVDPADVRLDDDGTVAWDSDHPSPGAVWFRDLAVAGHVATVVVVPDAGQETDELSVTMRTGGS